MADDVRGFDAFEAWLKSRGKAQGTIDMYRHDAGAAFAAGGFIPRLVAAQDKGLAPKTRRRIRTVGIQWARFASDDKLERTLREFQLPTAKRSTVKTPLERDQLEALITEIETADGLSDAERAVLGMIACRGFRIGDVLRLKRAELRAARDRGVLAFRAKGENRLEFKLIATFAKHALALAGAKGEEGAWTTVDELIVPKSKSASARRKSAARRIARKLGQLAAHCNIVGIHPHRLRRTYATEFLKGLKGDPDALTKLQQHMQWDSITTVAEYVDHARGLELDEAAERIFER